MEHNFECPNEGCAKQFKSAKCLDEHVIIGNCYSDHTKLSVTEKAKSLYSERLQNLYPSRNINLTEDGENSHPARVLGMGWALKADKVRVVFSDKQKEYMLEKYNQGKITGQKVDPYLASAEMRTSGRFTREEFLSGKQISSHFSRLCQNEKKTTKGDYKAAKVEENKAAIKTRLVKLLA